MFEELGAPSFYRPSGISPSKMDCILPVECVSLSVNLLSLYRGSLLHSFLRKAKGPHLEARPRNSPETWDMTILSHRRAQPSCLPPCILHKHPILINLLLTYPKKKFSLTFRNMTSPNSTLINWRLQETKGRRESQRFQKSVLRSGPGLILQ